MICKDCNCMADNWKEMKTERRERKVEDQQKYPNKIKPQLTTTKKILIFYCYEETL